jgi:hypothetical protein
MTQYTLKSLSEQFELLSAGLGSRNASVDERRAILRRMRTIIAAVDALVVEEEFRLDSEHASTTGND